MQSSATMVHEFTLTESCGRDWNDELVHFPVRWARGAEADAGVVMLGADGPLPTQLCAVKRYLDGSLASAEVWCRVSLRADECLTLKLQSTENLAPAPAPYWREEADGVVAGNGLFAVRTPKSGTYPRAAAPGVVMAVQIGEGEWLGCGTLACSRDLILTTELLECGPLFVRWSVRAHYEARTLATTECTIYAGEEFVHLRETVSRDADLMYTFDCFPGIAPNRLLTKGGGEHLFQQVRAFDYARPETLAIVDFHSGHHQMSLSWCGVYRDGGAPFLGIVELNGAQWTNLSVNRLRVEMRPPERLEIVSPLQGGVKEWAFVCSTTAHNLKADDDRVCNYLSRIHTRFTEVPLQKVKDWVLTWEDPTSYPVLNGDAATLEEAKARQRGNPELMSAYRRWAELLDAGGGITGSRASALATVWLALDDERYARQASEELEAEIAVSINRFWSEGGMMRLIIFDGRSMKMWLQAYEVLRAGGFIDPERDRRLKRDFAFLSYCFADPEFFPGHYNLADHNDPDGYFYGLGERIGDAMCPPNFHTEYYSTYGMMGCCFPAHPRAAAWRADAVASLERQLDAHYYDSGAYCESPNYHSHSFVMINQLALSLRNAGERDIYQHPRLKAQFDHFCRLQTPPVLMNEAARKMMTSPRLLDEGQERYAMMPSNGNTGSDCSDQMLPAELALGGRIYRDADPALSARCMTTWRRSGRHIANYYNDLTFFLLADITLPGTERVGLQSALLTGAFATFRGNPETEDEVFVLTKNGTATHHNDFDEGGFAIWAYGAPVAGDFGYHARHEGRTCGVGETWKHNCLAFDGKSSGYLGIEQTSPPEQWVSTPEADLLVSYLPITNLRDVGPYTYMDRIPIERIEYRRFTLFVKPHYLLIFDSVQQCAYRHQWWLHAQAESVEVEGPRVRFRSPFGVDLLAQFLLPAQPVITAGEWSVMKHISAEQAMANDWRVLVAPCKPGQDFTATTRDGGRIIEVAGPGYRDIICLAHFPFTVEEEHLRFRGRAGVLRLTPGMAARCTLLDGEWLEYA